MDDPRCPSSVSSVTTRCEPIARHAAARVSNFRHGILLLFVIRYERLRWSLFLPARAPARVHLHILQRDASAGVQALSRPRYPLEETRIVFQFVVKPIIFRSKTRQDARRLSMPGDNDHL